MSHVSASTCLLPLPAVSHKLADLVLKMTTSRSKRLCGMEKETQLGVTAGSPGTRVGEDCKKKKKDAGK